MNKLIFVFSSESSFKTDTSGFGINSVTVNKLNIDWAKPHKIVEGIYLLKDNVNRENFETSSWSKIESIINENKDVHFIHHSKPEPTVIRFIQQKGYKTYSGSHEDGQNGYNYYEPLKRLLTENNNEAEILKEWEKIFDSENTLELALNLLHDIYSGKPKSEFESDEYKELFQKPEIKENYDDLINSLTEGKYDHSQQAKLVALRDKILLLSVANHS